MCHALLFGFWKGGTNKMIFDTTIVLLIAKIVAKLAMLVISGLFLLIQALF
jgi:hypothetical protein